MGWNSISPYGITYIFSLPFTLIGIIKSFKINRDNKEIYKNIINIWFIASLLLLFVIEPNINRINIIMIPIIYYTIVGIFEVCNNNTITILIIIVYLISFILFTREYINTDFDKYMVFVDGVEDTIEYLDSVEAKTIYIQYSYKEPYIYYLFYNKVNPHDYIDTVKYFRENGSFDNVKAFGKYRYYLPESIEPVESTAYVLRKDNGLDINYSKWKVTEFKKFIVLENN